MLLLTVSFSFSLPRVEPSTIDVHSIPRLAGLPEMQRPCTHPAKVGVTLCGDAAPVESMETKFKEVPFYAASMTARD